MSAPQLGLDEYRRPVLQPPGGEKKVLVHSCCAPCAGEVLEALAASGLQLEVLFYNPNIHPKREYLLRKRESQRLCESLGIPSYDGDYDTQRWFRRIQGQEDEPERGRRCTLCFDMRFERSAEYAAARGFRVFTSTLGISRWKDMQQINSCGQRAAARLPGLHYWTFNWRKQGGAQRMIQISQREGFYQQEYCGCVYSLRDTNRRRKEQGRERIRIGQHYYGVQGAGQREGEPEGK